MSLPDMVLVDYDPFAMESRVSVVKEGNRHFAAVSSNISDLVNQLISLSQEENLYNMRIHAPVSTFFEIKRQMENQEQNLYSENKINLEII